MQLAAIILLARATLAAAPSDSATAPAKGTVERIKVHGKGLEGNSPDRDVSVYLPPSYTLAKVGNTRLFTCCPALPSTLRDGSTRCRPISTRRPRPANRMELIVVMPNVDTRYHGSFYGKSVTTGDWEDYVASELVSYIARITVRLQPRKPRAFHGRIWDYPHRHEAPGSLSSIYALSACCLDAGMNGAERVRGFAPLESIRTSRKYARRLSTSGSCLLSPPLSHPLPSILLSISICR